jgi:hypothetical protein
VLAAGYDLSDLHLAAAGVTVMGVGAMASSLPQAHPVEAKRTKEVILPPVRLRPPRTRRSAKLRATFSPLIESTPYRKASAAFFLSILILLFNPFVVIDGQTKFAMLVGIACGSVIWAGAVRAYPTMKTGQLLLLFFALYAVMAARMNYLGHDASFNYWRAIIQPPVCLFLFVASLYIVRRVGIRFYINAMTVALGVVCLTLLFNYDFLIDPPAYSPVGDFTYDSYQQVSTVFGLVGIMCLVRRMEWRKGSVARLLAALVFVVCAWVVVITSARGEQVAFAVTILIVIAPRLFIVIAAVAAFSVPAIIGVMTYYGLPSVERFQIALDLGWEEPRVVLIRQSLSLLMNDGATWLVG